VKGDKRFGGIKSMGAALHLQDNSTQHCQPTHGGEEQVRPALPALFFSFVTAAIVAHGSRIDHFSKVAWKLNLDQENLVNGVKVKTVILS
jgi:hypothetical protein